jgi:transcriptional regulator with XRE-family HTH domain
MFFWYYIINFEVMSMNTLGERLHYARKSSGYTQRSLADSIGVSRGVIFNLEKNKTEPQAIVINAICKTLNINKDWLMDGTGQMNNTSQALQSAKILAELYEVAKGLSENEQRYLLDVMYKLEPGYQKHSAD